MSDTQKPIKNRRSIYLTLIRVVPKVRRAQLIHDHVEVLYRKDIKKALATDDNTKVMDLQDAMRFEMRTLEQVFDYELTSSLRRQARRLQVPVAWRSQDGNDDLWYEADLVGARCLTAKGVNALRKEIREELKARHEMRVLWLPYLTGLLGVIGSITGLVAIVAK